MYAYYNNRRSFRSGSEHPQRRYRYPVRRSTAYLSQGMNVKRNSRCLLTKAKITGATNPLLANKRARRNTASLAPNARIVAKATRPLLPPEGDEDTSLARHVVRIIKGIWKLFKDTPPRSRFICVVLAVVVLFILSLLVNSMLQLVSPLMNLVYLIWGIMASVTAVEIWRELERR